MCSLISYYVAKEEGRRVDEKRGYASMVAVDGTDHVL
jgi:glucosamine 6-phosphate synthetase-like amidotransferase/phosphosugar isomerase protein